MRGGLVTPFHSNLNSPARCNGSLYSVHLSGRKLRWSAQGPDPLPTPWLLGFSRLRSGQPPPIGASTSQLRATPRRAAPRHAAPLHAAPRHTNSATAAARAPLASRRSLPHDRLAPYLHRSHVELPHACRVRLPALHSPAPRVCRECVYRECMFVVNRHPTDAKNALVHVTSSRLAHAPVFASRSFTQEQSES